jgi:prepilin-type N-terminal cleavage/methylation domain-containing protein
MYRAYQSPFMTRRQPGFTLIELVIAIVLLSVGAIALAGCAAAITRQMTVSARRSRAAMIARSRAEESQSRPCSALTGGSEELQGIRSDWDVSTSSVSAELGQQVEYRSLFGQRMDMYRTAAPCE